MNGYLIPLIENILEAQDYDIETKNFEKDKLFKKLKQESNKTGKYLICSSTFTDDFIGYKFRCEDEIVMVWKIINEAEGIFEDLKDYTESVVLVKLNKNNGQAILDRLKDELKKEAT